LADTRLFYEIGGAPDEFIALILETTLARVCRARLYALIRALGSRGGGGEGGGGGGEGRGGGLMGGN